MLRDAVEALRRNEATPEHPSPWIVLGLIAAAELWDDEAVSAITANGARHARERGDLQTLRAALHGLAMLEIWHGRFTAADAHLAEFHELSAVIGGARRFARPSRVTLLAWRGDHVRAHDAVTGLTMGPGEPGTIGGYPIQLARTALTVLELGRGRYREALTSARQVFDDDLPLFSNPALPDLVEAAARGGEPAVARAALERLAERATAVGTPWALGLLARSQALLAGEPEQHHLQAIACLERTRIVTDLARAHLLYGEWLRRERRRTEAHHHLHTAHTMFTTMGAGAFAERARSELAAIGHRTPRRTAETADRLTPRETRIAQLAARGATNREIAGQLYISAGTVEYHLRKVFQKLSITSRRQLPPEPPSG
ncbi:helix-turn-helix transcriptional regulator [Streptosporangium lutulentum]|uniref:DNA-binding CsgD family transcriptional regulator n=1 Tax=Streptosporangium lutulentum TaxID=1461250 RepID=A0ABT9Q7H4_9ACTN|nr:helix-turn-helix transcriptional regulator [Streptosporangium lutulentum]MDP9842360.1 DNA-binding CsgD family transcriptional regulator [Streptosporangium lutulentum]